VWNHPKPFTVKQLQAFLGVVNVYRRFVPVAAKILWPLTDSLKGGLKATAAAVWRGHLLMPKLPCAGLLCWLTLTRVGS
jgi:hypothetical protein